MSFFRQAPAALPGILGYASNITVSDLLKYTNQKREDAGLPKLSIDPKLTQAAQKKASHMFSKNYWAHVAPDGTEPWSFILAEDYDYIYAGENLAKNFNNSKDVVEAWYKSPSHRENLLSDKYVDVGFAVVNGVLDGYETTLVVQMFGKPRNAPAQVASKDTSKNVSTKIANEKLATTAVNSNVSSQPVYTPTPKVDVFSTTKTIILAFSATLLILFALDVWYSKRHGILKLTGHTFAHMAFLTFAVFAIYFALSPGRLM